MISRREFIEFSLVASGSCFFPRLAFADEQQIELVDSLGQKIELSYTPSEMAPLGNYARSVLYSIDPSLLGFGTNSDELGNGIDSFNINTLQHDGFSSSEISKPTPKIDVGSSGRSALRSPATAETQTQLSTIFLQGDFENLGNTYRTLARLLENERCQRMASYIDEVVSIVVEKQTNLESTKKKTLYVASGETGVEFETFKYLQENVFDYLNCECVNNRNEFAEKLNEEYPALSIDRIFDANPDFVIFKDIEPELFLGESSAARFLWKQMPQLTNDKALCAPRSEFGWLGSPLVSQCLGVLWLGSVLYPEFYGDVDLTGFAKRFYSLFVHSECDSDVLEALTSNRVVRI